MKIQPVWVKFVVFNEAKLGFPLSNPSWQRPFGFVLIMTMNWTTERVIAFALATHIQEAFLEFFTHSQNAFKIFWLVTICSEYVQKTRPLMNTSLNSADWPFSFFRYKKNIYFAENSGESERESVKSSFASFFFKKTGMLGLYTFS